MKPLLAILLGLAVMLPAWAQDLRPLRFGGWEELRRAHAGRPTVVHFWSLTCAPCLAELGAWARFKAANPHRDLVLVATDGIDQAGRIKAMLARHGLDGAENWAFAEGFVERLNYEIDPDWRGELPHTALIARGGAIRYFTGSLSDGGGEWLREKQDE